MPSRLYKSFFYDYRPSSLIQDVRESRTGGAIVQSAAFSCNQQLSCCQTTLAGLDDALHKFGREKRAGQNRARSIRRTQSLKETSSTLSKPTGKIRELEILNLEARGGPGHYSSRHGGRTQLERGQVVMRRSVRSDPNYPDIVRDVPGRQ